MTEDTTTFLSDTYIRCQKSYVVLVRALLDAQQSALVDEDTKAHVQDTMNDFMFYLNSILDNSTPEYWSDEEYAWIEGVCAEMKECERNRPNE